MCVSIVDFLGFVLFVFVTQVEADRVGDRVETGEIHKSGQRTTGVHVAKGKCMK